MNIFFREMKAYRRSLIIWCLGMLFFVGSGMGKYSATGQSVNQLFAELPRPVQILIGGGAFDLSKASGYYAAIFLYLAIMAAVHAAMLGAGIISKEEQDKTSEFLFVKPVSRSKIITSKLFAALANILILNIVTYIFSLIMVDYYSKGEAITGPVTILMAGMFMLQLIFLFLGTGIAALSKNPKSAVSITNGILLATFILSIAIDLSGRIDILKYLTPFKYFDAKVLMTSGFQSVFVILSAVIIAVSFCVTYVFYQKRNLNV